MSKLKLLYLFSVILAFGLGFFWVLQFPQTVKRQTVALQRVENEPYHRSVSLDRDYFDSFFLGVTSTAETAPVFSGVIPHHLIAGKYLAKFFATLKDERPSVVVLVGPNHAGTGRAKLISSLYNWKTAYGFMAPEKNIIQGLVDKKMIEINEAAIDTEFSIGAPVSFIKKTWPTTKILPIIVKVDTPTNTLDQLARELVSVLPPDSLVLASIDFSHYEPYFISNFHDVLSDNILETGNVNEISRIEIDSPPTLHFLEKYNALRGSGNFHLVSHSNSAIIAGHKEWPETTSHFNGYYTAGKFREDRSMSVQFFGDIMLDRSVAKVMGKAGLDFIFEKIKGKENRFFSGVDLFMANLEGPFAPNRVPTTKTIAFRFDPKLAKQLKQYNFDAVSLANNHTFDMGFKNAVYTERLLNENGIGYCGREYDEDAKYNLIFNGKDYADSVAFVCFENADHQFDKAKLTGIIEDAKQKARYVIMQIHGGVEYRRNSTLSQQELYRWFIDQGVTAVIGHHPHVVEEIEVYKGRPIVYSLGNFIFDQYFSRDTEEGLSVGLVLADGKVKELHFFPIFSVKSQVNLMTGERRNDFLKWLQDGSRLEGREITDGVLTL